MYFRLAVAAVAVSVLYLIVPAHATTRYVVPPTPMYDQFLPAVGLSGVEKKIDIKGNPTVDQWPEKGPVEGFGIAFAVLSNLKQKFPAKWTPAHFEKTKILIVGGLGGNTLGALHAALYLAKIGIQCDIYIIQNEQGNATPAEKHSKLLIPQMQGTPKINFVYLKKNLDTILEDEFAEVAGLKTALADAQSDSEKKKAVADIKSFFERENAHFKFNLESVSEYSAVLDTICGSSLATYQVKLGACKALDILNRARELLITVLSVDFPSMWTVTMSSIPDGYQLLGYGPVKPDGVIHIGSFKPFVVQCAGMVHYVVLPYALSVQLDSFVTIYRGDLANQDKILTIVNAFGNDWENEIVLAIEAQYILVGSSAQNSIAYFTRYLDTDTFVMESETTVFV